MHHPPRDHAVASAGIDCLIIGAGPAGLTAALYLRRFHRRVIVVDAGESRARYIERTRNFPGFPDGIGGPDLLARMRRQVRDMDGCIVATNVTRIAACDDGFAVRAGESTFRTRTVLIATGVADQAPVLPGIEPVMRKGLLRQCPICDGHEHTGRRIAVLGNGVHAQREAVFISDFSRPVSVVGLSAEAPAGSGSAEPSFAAALRDGRVRQFDSPAADVRLQEDGSIRLQLQDGTAHPFDVLYAALGCRPRSALALPLGIGLDASGHLAVDARCSTSVPGVYAAGDVASSLDQLAVAIGHGAIAATAIHNRCRD